MIAYVIDKITIKKDSRNRKKSLDRDYRRQFTKNDKFPEIFHIKRKK